MTAACETPVAPANAPETIAGAAAAKAAEKFTRLERFLERLNHAAGPAPDAGTQDSIARQMFERLRRSVALPTGARVLDVGCGEGAALALFRDAGLVATGIGPDDDVAVCRNRGFDAHTMDLSFLEFADESFDLIWCRHALEHSIVPFFALFEMFRVLRPGGVLYLGMPAADTASGHESNPAHYSVFGRRMWVELIRRTGFAAIETLDLKLTTAAGPDTYWSFVLCRPLPAVSAAPDGARLVAPPLPAVAAAPLVAPAPGLAPAPAGERVLVCVLGQLRAHQLTWANFKANVLETLGADLAVCIGTDDRFDPANPFYANARHRWAIPEFTDYAEGFELARTALGGVNDWRMLLSIKNQWLGGIRADNAHPGSGSIQIFFRWFLLHNILKDNLLAEYDRFIVTRSDFFYYCPHPPVDLLDRGGLWIPDGEDYGGLTDRHLVVAAADVEASLGLIDDIVTRPRALYDAMRGRADWNIERYMRLHFERKGLAQRVKRFPYIMFAVRAQTDGSSWSWGQFDPQAGMIVKYKSERDQAVLYKDVLTSRQDWEHYFSARNSLC